MLNQLINVSQDKLSDFNLPQHAVFEHILSQFIYRTMDNYAVSKESEVPESIIFLHDATPVKKDSVDPQVTIETAEILIQLMVDAVLKTDNKAIIGRYAPILFDLSLASFVFSTSHAQKRINLEYCIYRLVTYLIEHIEEFVREDTWVRVTNSSVLSQIHTHFFKIFRDKHEEKKTDLYGFLFLNLFEQMRKIDLMVL